MVFGSVNKLNIDKDLLSYVLRLVGLVGLNGQLQIL